MTFIKTIRRLQYRSSFWPLECSLQIRQGSIICVPILLYCIISLWLKSVAKFSGLYWLTELSRSPCCLGALYSLWYLAWPYWYLDRIFLHLKHSARSRKGTVHYWLWALLCVPTLWDCELRISCITVVKLSSAFANNACCCCIDEIVLLRFDIVSCTEQPEILAFALHDE